MASELPLNPREMVGALERHYVDYVLIGGLARVMRGADEVTDGLDICPAFGKENPARLAAALEELGIRSTSGISVSISEEAAAPDAIVALRTNAGLLQVVGSPAGVPNGFVDLRRGATKEYLGQGLQPLVASTGDLARMAAALGRVDDLRRLRVLRRIMELEVDREQTLAPPADLTAKSNRRATKDVRLTR